MHHSRRKRQPALDFSASWDPSDEVLDLCISMPSTTADIEGERSNGYRDSIQIARREQI